jgi:hypothetical protein
VPAMNPGFDTTPEINKVTLVSASHRNGPRGPGDLPIGKHSFAHHNLNRQVRTAALVDQDAIGCQGKVIWKGRARRWQPLTDEEEERLAQDGRAVAEEWGAHVGAVE